MRRETDEETIKFINIWLEMICDDMRYDIKVTDIPAIEQLVESTGSSKEKIVEGLEHWHSGMYRRNG